MAIPKEAAENNASKSWVYGGVFHEAAKNTFKAGAKWMAGHGVSKEAVNLNNTRGDKRIMQQELKRRDLSGIYIFDTFPGESHRRPTCIEDCQPETRRKLLLTMSTEWQRECIMKLADTFKDMCNYLVDEHCVTDEQRTEFFKMIDRNVERAKYNWAPHEMVSQVDFFCKTVTLLADACGVTRHKEEEDSE